MSIKIQKMKFSSLYLSAFLAALLSCTNQQIPQDPIPTHDTFTIQSKGVGEKRTINVWTPDDYKTKNEALPVLYMPDGGIKEDFPHIANTIAQLIKDHKIKPLILVGIENTERRRDLTGPTIVAKDKEIAPVVGGSENFRSFIQDELIPEINKRYKTTNEKSIIGESLAGLFVIETFLLTPNLFDRYIAFDPSLWWNDQYLLKNSNNYFNNFPKENKTLWFAGSNAEDIYKNTENFAAQLSHSNLPNVRWRYAPEPKEQHSTIFRATKEKAIIWAFSSFQSEN
jgi:predicted alpha/beta superfamily hydrolase